MTEKVKIKPLGTEPIVYNGSVSDFRAWMEKLFSRNGNRMAFPLSKEQSEEMMRKAFDKYNGKSDIIPFNNFKSLYVDYSERDQESNREVWYVSIYDPTVSQNSFVPRKWSTILAIEQPINVTTIQFLDGICFRYEAETGEIINYARGNPIGDMFSTYTSFLKSQLEIEEQAKIIDGKERKLKQHLDTLKSITYPYSVSNFRAWMDRYFARYGNVVTIATEQEIREYRIIYAQFAKDIAREVWNVEPIIPFVDGKRDAGNRHGMILAIEDIPNQTTIEFIDGSHYVTKGGLWPYPQRGHRDYQPTAPLPDKAVLENSEPIGNDFAMVIDEFVSKLGEQKLKTGSTDHLELWERIPNLGWDREALRLWHLGDSHAEIGRKLRKTEQTVKNRVRALRKEHGEEIVPSRRRRKST